MNVAQDLSLSLVLMMDAYLVASGINGVDEILVSLKTQNQYLVLLLDHKVLIFL
jgi:hypothetical protein